MDTRLLTPADLGDLMRLKEAAGWNQTEGDWLRLMQLEPNGCFGVEVDGKVVASATAVCYARKLAWIGMVLTHPEHRGKGMARALMERCLQYTGRRPVGLDATDMGKPLYTSLGFVDECRIERWCKPAGEVGPAYLRPDRNDPCRYDEEVNGADRSDLLSALQMYEWATLGKGYAFGRPGSDAVYFGPCAAESHDDALDLLRWFLNNHLEEKVFWDLPPQNQDAKELAFEHGFRPYRKLTRMILKRDPRPPDQRLYAIAGFEYG